MVSEAVRQAAGTLQRIAETTTGERALRASAVALVLRTVQALLDEGGGREFLVARAAREVEAVGGAGERSMLKRLLLLAERGGPEMERRLAEALVGYGCELERSRRLPEADAVLGLACSVAPESAEVALHAGRVARKQADRERALAHYRRARGLDVSGGALGRLAGIGEAVVSDDALRALGRAMREAVRAADPEAAGVALEERGRLRRETGARTAAVRDLCAAAVRFVDPVDRARVAHQIADVCVAADDPRAAREALLVALALGDATQKDHARSRLHTVSRDLEDQLGMRRWRSFSRPALVSLSARTKARAERSAEGVLARWRERVERRIESVGETVQAPGCQG